MDTSNGRPTQGARGAVGDPAMESGDWRAQLQRQRIGNKIMDTLKTLLPFSGYERLHELKKIAERIEDENYAAATSQSEYARKMCFMMLTMETRLQNIMSDPMQSNSAANGVVYPSVTLDTRAQTNNSNNVNWQEEVYQKIKAMKELYLLESGDWKAQLQDSSILSSALPPGNALQQHTLTNVAGQNLNMQNIQNMSNVQRNQLIGQQYNYLVTHDHILYQEQLRQQQMLQPLVMQPQLQQQLMVQQQRLKPTEGASAAVGDPAMESGDWRAQLEADTRERIVNKIIDTLKRHSPFSGHDEQPELKKIAERIEEEIYTTATSQHNYLLNISMKMLTIQLGSQYPASDPM